MIPPFRKVRIEDRADDWREHVRLKQYPNERFKVDLYCHDSDHHGVGATLEIAMHNAILALTTFIARAK